VNRDFLNAHDGAEFLHRVLWDLDLWHEYHLVRNADHGGPTFTRCLPGSESLWNSMPPEDVAEHSASVWLQSGRRGKPPARSRGPLIRSSVSFGAQFEPIPARDRGERPHHKPPLSAICPLKPGSLFLPLLAGAGLLPRIDESGPGVRLVV
jgi:hypothetical protein